MLYCVYNIRLLSVFVVYINTVWAYQHSNNVRGEIKQNFSVHPTKYFLSFFLSISHTLTLIWGVNYSFTFHFPCSNSLETDQYDINVDSFVLLVHVCGLVGYYGFNSPLRQYKFQSKLDRLPEGGRKK